MNELMLVAGFVIGGAALLKIFNKQSAQGKVIMTLLAFSAMMLSQGSAMALAVVVITLGLAYAAMAYAKKRAETKAEREEESQRKAARILAEEFNRWSKEVDRANSVKAYEDKIRRIEAKELEAEQAKKLEEAKKNLLKRIK